VPPVPEGALLAFEETPHGRLQGDRWSVAVGRGGFTAFGVALAPGMLSLPAVTAPLPPPGLVGFVQLFVMPYPESAEDGVDAVVDIIDTWIKTGTATTPLGSISWS
jgi:hypothetical protein